MRRMLYVKVTAEVDTLGNIRPLSIHWQDGRVFEVDRVLDVRPAPATVAGGHGIRYTVRIRGKETYIYKDDIYDAGWFVEAKTDVCSGICSGDV